MPEELNMPPMGEEEMLEAPEMDNSLESLLDEPMEMVPSAEKEIEAIREIGAEEAPEEAELAEELPEEMPEEAPVEEEAGDEEEMLF